MLSELALALANQGAGSVLVQRRELERAHVESAAMLALMVGTVLTAATFFLLPLATTPLFGQQTTELFQLLSPTFVIAALGIVPLAMLERQLNFRRISIIEIATVLVGAVSSVILAVAGLEAEAYVLGFLAGLTVWAILLLIFGPSVRPRWRSREIREIARFGLPAGLASMAMVGYGNVDYLILGSTLSPSQVGFYYRAYTLGVQYERKISDIIARLAFPVYSRTENLDHMREVRSRVVRINATVIYPILAVFIAVATLLVPWLFGERWEPAVVPAQILAVAGMARMINNGTAPLMLAAGRPRALLVFNLVRLGTLAAAIILAVPYGLTAVCITVAAVQVLILLGSYGTMLARMVGVDLRQLMRDIGPALVSSFVLLAAAFPVTRALTTIGLPRPVTILAVCALGAPLYLLALRVVSPGSWADLILLTRRVLRPNSKREKGGGPLPGSHTPSGQVNP